MDQSLSNNELARYTAAQCNAFFPDDRPVDPAELALVLPQVLERLRLCLNGLLIPRFYPGGRLRFDHLQSDQYSMYLYLLANSAWKSGEKGRNVAAKSYLLNKALNSLEVYYEVEMPQVFWFAHSLGTVLGRARYGNGFVVMQGCTVGNKGNDYPTLGERVILCSQSTVLGACTLGNEVCVGSGSLLINVQVPDGSTAVGREKSFRCVPKKSSLLKTYFREANCS